MTPGPVAGPTRDTRGPDREGDGGRAETVAGGIMVGLVLLAALWFRFHPGSVFLDRWVFSLVHPEPHNGTWIRITDLRSVPVLAGGSVLAAVVVVDRDRWRALACLGAPVLAVVLTEYLVKPVIARRYAEVLTFPSGTTTGVASVTMAWVLAVPARIRMPVAVIGAVVVGLECVAVVALQWHLPTDALGGAVFGAGVVLLVDGSLHVIAGGVRRRRNGTSARPDDTTAV